MLEWSTSTRPSPTRPGYDGVIEENMVLCVESYIGEVGGHEGVKLEEQVLITATGAVPMSKTPIIDALVV